MDLSADEPTPADANLVGGEQYAEPIAPGPHPAWHHGPAAPALVFFTSGAVLVIEILAGRLVAPYVGVSLETYTGIIGTVLAGIAIGSAAGGRAADRRDPNAMLGPLLAVSGIAVLSSLPIIALLGPNIASQASGPVGIVVLALTAFVLPTALLSAVSPMVAKLRLDTTADTGTVVGNLSAAGTAGALVGTFATGFIFVAAWPTRPIIVVLGVIVAVLGVVVSFAGHRRRDAVVPLVGVLLAGVLAQTVPSPCETQTRYFCVDVVPDPTRPSGRTLILDNLRHSYVDLDDPAHLEFRYARLFAAAVDSNLGAPTDRPVEALHIGGGGFTFPRWLNATRPGSTNRVLEIDPEVVALAERELGLVRSPALDVHVGDARLNIAEEPSGRYGLVVGDAFGSLSVPWHLTTVEMVREIERTLTPDGIYILNMIDAGPQRFVRAELATLRAVFDHVAVVRPPDAQTRNYVLVAGNRPVAVPVAAEDGSLVTGEALDRYIDGAEPLRDDYAPADQLITRL